MYIPPHFDERRIELMHDLIRARPLATLVTVSRRGLNANHLPFQLIPGEGAFGTLRGHIARSNPLWQELDGGVEALAVFHGPEGYVSPSWYPTKRDDGKVIPTWNYVVVHAHGTLHVVDDEAWLRVHLQTLTDAHEAAFSEPWAMTDAPGDYIDRLVAKVVGIEMVVARLEGKWKLSQNQAEPNRVGVVQGLEKRGGERALELAALVGEDRNDGP